MVGDYVLDTGASDLFINDKVKKGSPNAAMPNAMIVSEDTKVNNFIIGSLEFTNFEATLIDLSSFENLLGFQIHGLIGSSILNRFSIYIDYCNKNIEFYDDIKKVDIAQPFDYQITSLDIIDNSIIPVIELTVENEVLRFAFDTGANHNILSHQLRSLFPSSGETISTKLNVSDIFVENTVFTFQNLEYLNDNLYSPIDGILSPEILNVSKALIDTKRMKVFLFWKL